MKNNETEKYIPFALPDIGEEEIEAVVSCMRSGWMTTGPNARQFEKDFSEFVENKNSVSVNSATAGLMLAMEAAGVADGDEVITTPYTFSATAMSAVYLGAKPVLVDIDPVTLNINADLIEKAITKKTKAIVPVHFAGLACDMDKIISIAKKHGLKIIEDAAHALPATYKGKIIGSLDTDAAVYSFYATKTITTGEGGMIVSANDDIAARCKITRLHGISRDVFDRYTSEKPAWYYEIVAKGYKCNLTDIAASIGIHQLKKANKFQQCREKIAKKYKDSFKDLPLILPADAPNGDVHSWHLFVIRITDAKITRDDFIKRMSEEYRIGCSVHFIPLNHHPYWKETLGINESSFPEATKAFSSAVSLPVYTKMTDEEVDRVIKAVRGVFE